MNDSNKIEKEIHIRVMTGNRAYSSHLKLFKLNILSKKTKIKLYKTLIRPIVAYGAETWTIKTADEQHLRVFERKIIRRIYGPVFIDEYLINSVVDRSKSLIG